MRSQFMSVGQFTAKPIHAAPPQFTSARTIHARVGGDVLGAPFQQFIKIIGYYPSVACGDSSPDKGSSTDASSAKHYSLRSPNRTLSDSFGQARAQRPQRMHSTELNCFIGSIPIGQTVSHLPQCTQVGSS